MHDRALFLTVNKMDDGLIYRGEFIIELDKILKDIPSKYLEDELKRRNEAEDIFYDLDDIPDDELYAEFFWRGFLLEEE